MMQDREIKVLIIGGDALGKAHAASMLLSSALAGEVIMIQDINEMPSNKSKQELEALLLSNAPKLSANHYLMKTIDRAPEFVFANEKSDFISGKKLNRKKRY